MILPHNPPHSLRYFSFSSGPIYYIWKPECSYDLDLITSTGKLNSVMSTVTLTLLENLTTSRLTFFLRHRKNKHRLSIPVLSFTSYVILSKFLTQKQLAQQVRALTAYSCRGPNFHSQHPHNGLQQPVFHFLGIWHPLLALMGTRHACGTNALIWAKHPYTRINKCN